MKQHNERKSNPQQGGSASYAESVSRGAPESQDKQSKQPETDSIDRHPTRESSDGAQRGGVLPTSKGRLDRWEERLRLTCSILTSTFLIVLFIAVLLVGLREYFRDTVFLDPIEVPKDLQEQGYTPSIVAQRLVDEIAANQKLSEQKTKRLLQ